MNKLKDINILKTLYSLKSFGYDYSDTFDMNYANTNNINLPDDMGKLKDIVNHCSLCSFSKSRNNILFANGTAKSGIMIVTFSPTDFEDSDGRFYVGRAGELIYNIVTKVLNQDVNNVFITSVLKCKAILQDDSLVENVNICKSYLIQQIKLLNPRIILFFGENVYNHLTLNDDFEYIKGTIFDWADTKVIATYEHTHILKNPTLKKEVFDSMLKVKNFLE
ncbi:MAG: uracil-DNA glycosylase [Campylobacterota bacterium]